MARKSGGEDNALFAYERIVEVLEIQPIIEEVWTELSGGRETRVPWRGLTGVAAALLLDEPSRACDLKLRRASSRLWRAVATSFASQCFT